MNKNVIPPITDPLGRYWNQPPLSEILIDDTHAVMTKATFKALSEYSSTFPTGVYPGKMWRRHDGAFDSKCKLEDRRWLLVWFGIATEGKDPDKFCSNNWREILLLEEFSNS